MALAALGIRGTPRRGPGPAAAVSPVRSSPGRRFHRRSQDHAPWAKGRRAESAQGASKRTRQNIARRLFGPAPAETVSAEAAPTEPGKITEEFGLFRNIPRTMKTEVGRYLAEREADPEWFDGCVLTARKAMKRLYALLHVRPGERAQKILFEEGPARGESAVRAADVGRGQEPGRAGPGDRRASDSVSCGSHGGSSDDTHGVGGSDRADEPSGIDQQPGRRCAVAVPWMCRKSRRWSRPN